MNCKNCKYYIPGKDGVKWGECNHPAMLDDDTKEADEAPIDGVYATCDEYRGQLFVGEEFGCIHFKEKE